MIDPACGSGHFLLGSFARILGHWRKVEPGTNDRELVNRAIASVHGVDLNPYAVAIASFRLLLAAMKECQVTQIKDAPDFQFNLACGDSLLHGLVAGEQQVMGFHKLAHHYQSEDIDELRRILKPGQYHAVVANPPYITVKDRALNQAYRDRYPDVCHRKYSLAVPFLQRIFDLACEKAFTGQITANSFMKREFGKKLIESFFPFVDLTHVIDTSGAYIPGHGTPTVILLGRNRHPVNPTVRAVMGIRGEPSTPSDPTQGKVWTAILQQIDRPGSQSEFVSISDTDRQSFCHHPWSIGGGGVAELKVLLDKGAEGLLRNAVDVIGIFGMTNADEVMLAPDRSFARYSVETMLHCPLVIGDQVRDWNVNHGDHVLFPYYCEQLLTTSEHPGFHHWLWPCRTVMGNRATFGKLTYFDEGRPWWEWHQVCLDRLRTRLSITLAFVTTHNHFVLDRGGKVFNRSAPVIKLPPTATEDEHFGLLGLLNSSTACFWMQQTMHNKGGPGGASSKDEKWHDFYEFAGTQLKQYPLPEGRPLTLASRLDALAQQLATLLPDASINKHAVPTAVLLAEYHRQFQAKLAQMIALQEELDWTSYGLYGLLPQEIDPPLYENPPSINLGQRAFEIVLARQVGAGEVETKWFTWLGITPNTDIPSDWPEDYRQVVQHRIEIIENASTLALIEDPRCKRRWETEPWEQQQQRALRNWLLDRLESYFDLDGRMNEQKLTSVAKVADFARQDKDFMQVAELYTARGEPEGTSMWPTSSVN